MTDDPPLREEMENAAADPYRAPAIEPVPAASPVSKTAALHVLEWLLGLPLVLIGLAQCGMAALGLALSFVADVPMSAGMAAALFGNGLMLAVPGVLLCLGRSWAAWLVLVFALFAAGVGLAGTFLPLAVFGGILIGFALTILVLSARRRRSDQSDDRRPSRR